MSSSQMSEMDRFFRPYVRRRLALTFDDVRLTPGYTSVPATRVNLDTRFSRGVPLKIPIVSAAMDTVTEWRMAIAMAKCGGLGIIHRSLPPKEQAAQVARVKHYRHGLIAKPITVRETETMAAIEQMLREKQYPFHSLLVLDENDRLSGILTRKDFEFHGGTQKTAAAIMNKHLRIAPVGTDLEEAYRRMEESPRITLLPIVDSDRRVHGLYTSRDVNDIRRGLSAQNNLDAQSQLRVGAAISPEPMIRDEELERVALLVKEQVDVVVIDTAHADQAPVYELIPELRREFPNLQIVAGNISEPEAAARLAKADVDGIKVGIGPGSICTTRLVSGVGTPQVTALYRCAKAIRGSDIPLCADGGLSYSGDATIALAFASSVMMGSMLAGTTEAPGEVVALPEGQIKRYRGMGSLGAMIDSEGARQRYGQVDTDVSKLVPEGIEGGVAFRGDLAPLMIQYIGGLRKGMWYVGAGTINELHEKALFYRITNAGREESHPHGVLMMKRPPNYQGRG